MLRKDSVTTGVRSLVTFWTDSLSNLRGPLKNNGTKYQLSVSLTSIHREWEARLLVKIAAAVITTAASVSSPRMTVSSWGIQDSRSMEI